MIKANELRIGNWVDGGVNGNLYYRIKASDFVNTRFDLTKPIPLTPEILEKCGFIINMTGTAWWSDNEVILIGQRGDYLYYSEWGGTSDEPTVDEKFQLKSLHQLQNLYFALTGHELDINL